MSGYRKAKSIGGLLTLVMVLGVMGYLAYEIFFSQIPTFNQEVVDKAFEEDKDYCYFYDQLNDSEQKIYKELFYGFSNFTDKINLMNTDVNQIQNVLDKVLYDHPELYYINSRFQYQDMHQYIVYIPQYDYTKDEVEQYNKQIETHTKDILIKASQEKDELLKAKMIYEFVIQKNEYHTNSKTDQNIISSLIEGKNSVCRICESISILDE